MRRFGEYIDGLGTQPVTVTVSSLVEDMLDSYANVTNGLQGFSWKHNLPFLIEEFIYSRDCWLYTPMRAPVVEATFSVSQYGVEQLDILIAFSWSPPRLGFHDLANVIAEGDEYNLKPTFPTRAHRAALAVTAEYFVGPGTDCWIRWDDSTECFRGTISPTLASLVGAERFDTYTIPLELTARVTHHYPADIRFERIVRCALPLTVKRRPNRCAVDGPSAEYDRENCLLSLEDVKLLDRKAQGRRAQSPPLLMDSLSLAQLHDAVAAVRPAGISTTVLPASGADGASISLRRDTVALDGVQKAPVAAWSLLGIEQAGYGPSEEAIDYWQATTQRNFSEFTSTREERLDDTMEDIVESDEERGE